MKALFITALVFSQISFAATTEIENVCRAKAKEVATSTYKTCVYENKSVEIQKLQKEFQDELKQLKASYEDKIKKLGGKIKNPSQKEKVAKSSNVTAAPEGSAEQNSGDEIKVKMNPVAPAGSQDDSSMEIPEPVQLN